MEIYVVRNGVNIVTQAPGKFGIIDIEADQAVIWRGPDPEEGQAQRGPNGEYIDEPVNSPWRSTSRGMSSSGRTRGSGPARATSGPSAHPRVYYNFLTDRFVAHDAEIDMFSPGLLAPMRVKSPRIEQYHDLIKQPDGTFKPDPSIQDPRRRGHDDRQPVPRPRLQDLPEIDRPDAVSPGPPPTPSRGSTSTNPGDPNPPQDLVWQIDARQNIYYMGPFPAFYWPRVVADLDDQQPAFRQFFFRTNNYFGQQLLTDWNGVPLLPGVKKPDWIDLWNVDIDYLSAGPRNSRRWAPRSAGSARDLIKDLRDPYHRDPSARLRIFTYDYFGYFNIWGLQGFRHRRAGPGPGDRHQRPARRRQGRASRCPARRRSSRTDCRFDFRHMQSIPRPTTMSTNSRTCGSRSRPPTSPTATSCSNTTSGSATWAWTRRPWPSATTRRTTTFLDIWTEGNPMNWQTETQWLPRVDYYRIGDSFLDNHLIYYQHSGLDYATITTDIMVNNPNLFAFMPYDPISNTSGTFSSGRFYTSHELDVPLNFFNAVRVVPYVQGQLVGWTDQLGGGPLGHRPSGPTGPRLGRRRQPAEMTLWKKYPNVSSELLNIHGLNNKISLFVDARAAFSNVRLNQHRRPGRPGRQHLRVRPAVSGHDQLPGRHPAVPVRPPALHPAQHALADHRHDRHPGVDRYGAARHPPAAPDQARPDRPAPDRRLHDARRDDHVLPRLGPRQLRHAVGPDAVQLSVVPRRPDQHRQPGLVRVLEAGRQPRRSATTWSTATTPTGSTSSRRGSACSGRPGPTSTCGYTIIDTGPIKTSALNTSISYWLSPKWYGTFANSYDFGDGVDLGTMFTFTRIGADYLTTIGLSVDPQRMSYQFAVQITPRMTRRSGWAPTRR